MDKSPLLTKHTAPAANVKGNMLRLHRESFKARLRNDLSQYVMVRHNFSLNRMGPYWIVLWMMFFPLWPITRPKTLWIDITKYLSSINSIALIGLVSISENSCNDAKIYLRVIFFKNRQILLLINFFIEFDKTDNKFRFLTIKLT